MTGYDVIGDVHGCADELEALLRLLGYRERGGVWRHGDRQAVFVGDLIDRGPRQVDTVTIVRSMVDAGAGLAAMGNHEFNAIAWATPNTQKSGEYLRKHSAKNHNQHAAFLEQVDEGSPLHREMVGWFRTLPMRLDLGGLRVTHACWHEESLAVLPDVSDDRPLSVEFLHAAHDRSSAEYHAVETVLKGPEMPVPEAYLDKDRHPRTNARVRWWDRSATTMRGLAEIPPNSTTKAGDPYPELADTPYPEAERFRYDGAVPVVFGHYWRRHPGPVVDDLTACVDLSAVRGGHLAAYRWHGEPTLDPNNLVMVGSCTRNSGLGTPDR